MNGQIAGSGGVLPEAQGRRMDTQTDMTWQKSMVK